MALAVAIFFVVLVIQIVSWIGKTVIQEAVRAPLQRLGIEVDRPWTGVRSLPQLVLSIASGEATSLESRNSHY